MKRILYIAAALLLAACAREVLPEPAQPEENQEAKTYTVTLTASFDPETRLSISSIDGDGYWSETDEIAIFTRNGNLVKGTIKQGDFHTTNPKFTFEIETDDAIVDGAIAYYPYSIAVEGHSNQIRLPDTYTNANVQYRTVPMKAVVTNAGRNLSFKHLASMLYVTAPSAPSYPSTNQSPQVILFETSGTVTGLFNVGGTTDAPTLTAADNNGTSSISTAWLARGNYMFVLPAGDYNGFSLSIKSNDGFVFYKKTRSSLFSAKRATLVKMPEFDGQCKEFYLISASTGWSNTSTEARMIQSGTNTYVGALNSFIRDGMTGQDLGYKILQPFNMDGTWKYVIGAGTNYSYATYGDGLKNIAPDASGVHKITFYANPHEWRYDVERVGDEFNHQQQGGGLRIVGSFDDWNTNGGIPLTQHAVHNWTAQIVVSDDAMIKPYPDHSYTWKIKRNDGWAVQWGAASISNSELYDGMELKQGDPDPVNATLSLSAGTYDVFFNDAIGQIMFVKK